MQLAHCIGDAGRRFLVTGDNNNHNTNNNNKDNSSCVSPPSRTIYLVSETLCVTGLFVAACYAAHTDTQDHASLAVHQPTSRHVDQALLPELKVNV